MRSCWSSTLNPTCCSGSGGNRITEVSVVEMAEHDIAIWMLAALLRHLCTRRTRPKPRTIDAVGGELTSELVDLLHGPKILPPKGCGLMPRDREKVFQFIRNNLKYDIHVADLAKQTGHSIKGISRDCSSTRPDVLLIIICRKRLAFERP